MAFVFTQAHLIASIRPLNHGLLIEMQIWKKLVCQKRFHLLRVGDFFLRFFLCTTQIKIHPSRPRASFEWEGRLKGTNGH